MAVGYFSIIAEQIGIPLSLLTVILIWTAVWKLLALWKSARNGALIWFIVMAIFNTVGILPILYIFIFSRLKYFKKIAKPVLKTKKRKRR